MHSVLVIDDDFGTRETFDRILHLAGFEVATAATGDDGLTMARSRPFNVILAARGESGFHRDGGEDVGSCG